MVQHVKSGLRNYEFGLLDLEQVKSFLGSG